MKKSWLALLAIGTILLIVAGCSGKDGNEKPADYLPERTGESAELPMANGKYDPPVTITTVKGVSSTWKFRPGECSILAGLIRKLCMI